MTEKPDPGPELLRGPASLSFREETVEKEVGWGWRKGLLRSSVSWRHGGTGPEGSTVMPSLPFSTPDSYTLRSLGGQLLMGKCPWERRSKPVGREALGLWLHLVCCRKLVNH